MGDVPAHGNCYSNGSKCRLNNNNNNNNNKIIIAITLLSHSSRTNKGFVRSAIRVHFGKVSNRVSHTTMS